MSIFFIIILESDLIVKLFCLCFLFYMIFSFFIKSNCPVLCFAFLHIFLLLPVLTTHTLKLCTILDSGCLRM